MGLWLCSLTGLVKHSLQGSSVSGVCLFLHFGQYSSKWTNLLGNSIMFNLLEMTLDWRYQWDRESCSNPTESRNHTEQDVRWRGFRQYTRLCHNYMFRARNRIWDKNIERSNIHYSAVLCFVLLGLFFSSYSRPFCFKYKALLVELLLLSKRSWNC